MNNTNNTADNNNNTAELPPPYEPRELPPYESIVPDIVLGESEESESDGWYVSDKSESYLRMFDRQYTIHYRDWYHSDPSIFMDEVRELIISRLKRENKVKMVLKWVMKSSNKATGEKTIVEVKFHSGVEKIHNTTFWPIYICDKIVGRIKKRLSNWSMEIHDADDGSELTSIVSLEIHACGV